MNDGIDGEAGRNDFPMDITIGMEPSIDFQLLHKHISIYKKDDYSSDDPVLDIVKLFGTPPKPSEFSIYVILHQLSPTILKLRCEIKKILNLVRSLYISNQEKEIERRD